MINTPCHLALRLLDADDPCGACGRPARLHRAHRAFVEADPVIDPRDARIADLESTNALLDATCDEPQAKLAWKSRPSEVPRVGPAITREDARAYIGGFSTYQPGVIARVERAFRAHADNEPAPTETVPATLRGRAAECLKCLADGTGWTERAIDILRDIANAPIANEWDEAIEAAWVAFVNTPAAFKTTTGPTDYYVSRAAYESQIAAMKRGAK